MEKTTEKRISKIDFEKYINRSIIDMEEYKKIKNFLNENN